MKLDEELWPLRKDQPNAKAKARVAPTKISDVDNTSSNAYASVTATASLMTNVELSEELEGVSFGKKLSGSFGVCLKEACRRFRPANCWLPDGLGGMNIALALSDEQEG